MISQKPWECQGTKPDLLWVSGKEACSLSIPMAIFRFLQTIQIHVSQFVAIFLTCNLYCLPFNYQNIPKLLITWEMETSVFEHRRDYFKQLRAERVMFRSQSSYNVNYFNDYLRSKFRKVTPIWLFYCKCLYGLFIILNAFFGVLHCFQQC